MKIALDKADGHNIKSYQPGELKIDDELYKTSQIVASDVIEKWAPENMEAVTLKDIASLLNFSPEIVLLGTGAEQKFIAPNLVVPLLEARVGYECMTTSAACRTFNVLSAEGRRVLAAVIV